MIIKFLIAIILICNPILVQAKQENLNKMPEAKKLTHTFEIHDQKINDEYHWLRDKEWPDKIANHDILDYLNQENDYFNKFMEPLADLKNEIFEELKGRIKLKDQSVPVQKDNYFYYSRTEADKDYTIYCRKKNSIDAEEEILLDVNELAKGKKFTTLGAFSISPDHKIMAYSVDFSGSEKYTIKLFDLEKQKLLPDEIPDTISGIVWHENIDGFFYTPTNEQWRHDKVMFHKLGEDIKKDKLILHEKDPLYSVSVRKSSSKKYIFIDVGGHDSNETYYFSMKDINFSPILVKKRVDRVQYSIDHGIDAFYLHTNDNAKNFKILKSKLSEAKEFSWFEYIAEEEDKYLSSFDISSQYLMLNYRDNGLPLIKVENLATRNIKIVSFPDESYTASAYGTNFELNDIRINYSSLSRPTSVFEYNFDNEKLTILKVQEIPSGFNPEEYKTKRIFAKSKDGTRVPVTLLYKKLLFKNDGSNPLYLYGYGSYGIGIAPSFRNSAISLVNRGFVFAIAHIRGGDDLGHDWYEAAKFLNKKRSFEDFIASAGTLIEQKYSSTGNIVIVGGSAGGMLIGNVINQRPELFKAAIAHVPFVDVLNTMLDETLPLTPGEFKEWGNPTEKEYFEYMQSYSPYDNVTQQAYPSLMVTAGLSDPRVGYWEAAKWVAKLRDKKTDKNPIILKTNMEFGHQGASARFDYLKEAAEDLVFILQVFKKF